MNTKIACSIAVLTLALNGAAQAEAPKFASGLLVDAQGMTLYTFDKDAQGRSNCNGGCAAAWPPAAAATSETGAGDFTVMTRDDGARQWAFKGAPLYRYAADVKAGDTAGDRQGNVWHAVRTGRASEGNATGPATGYRSSY